MSDLKIGICGLGNMGSKHLKVYESLNRKVDVFTYDPVCGESWSYFLEKVPELDGISICSPSKYHVETALTFLKINPNIKLLIEKPISYTLEDGETLLPYEKNIMVGFVERFNPVTLKFREMLKKDFGTIYSIVSQRFGMKRKDFKENNVAKDLLIHDIDLLNFITGQLPHQYKLDVFREGDSINYASLKGKFNTFNFFCESCWGSPYSRRIMSVTSSSGYFVFNYMNRMVQASYSANNESFVKGYTYSSQEPLKNELNAFLDMCEGKDASGCTVTEAINALKLVTGE